MRTLIVAIFTIAALVLDSSVIHAEGGRPTQDELRSEVVRVLDILVSEIESDGPVEAAVYTSRLRTYLDAHRSFYGSAVALVNEAGAVTNSPYVYRTPGGYETLDLALPSYGIEKQDWFTLPMAEKTGIWTSPYFDAGGGEIWMITRSVPAWYGGRIFAIVTTDLPVAKPERLRSLN